MAAWVAAALVEAVRAFVVDLVMVTVDVVAVMVLEVRAAVALVILCWFSCVCWRGWSAVWPVVVLVVAAPAVAAHAVAGRSAAVAWQFGGLMPCCGCLWNPRLTLPRKKCM